MPKVSPAKLNFNAGEWAVTVEGRTDLDRYPSSMRQVKNAIAAPQGPCIRRSGTVFVGRAYDHAKHSGLVSFVFSDEQAQILEFCDERIRFVDEDGFQVYEPVSVTNVVTTSPFKFTSAALVSAGIAEGDEVIFEGFSDNININGVLAKVTAVAGNDVTVDVDYGGVTGAVSGPTVAKLYHISSPYGEADVRNVVVVQDIEILYLFCNGYRPRMLSRTGAYAWVLEALEFVDGPFDVDDPDVATLTPDSRGWAIGLHTSNASATPDTGDVSADTENNNHAAFYAVDGDRATYWEGSKQSSILTYRFAAPTIVEGYTIYMARKNVNNSAEAPKSNAPVTWTIEARNGSDPWVVVDEKIEYPSYKNLRTQYIKMNNKTAYSDYRLNVEAVDAAGEYRVRVGQLVFRKAGDVTIGFTASSTSKINKGQGFVSTDVGRLIRVQQGDGFWRSLQITAVTDSTHITAKLQGEPLYDLSPIRRWRMGYFSDTTGWPTVGTLWNSRLAVGGATDYPTLVALSAVFAPKTFSPTDPDGTVIDDNGMAEKLNTRRASPIRWLIGDQRGLLIGCGDSEWILQQDTQNQGFSARNKRAAEQTARGSAAIQPVKIDRQVVFAQASRRTIREYSYNFESDGYKSPSMSLYAPHLGVPPFAQMAYAAEPHSIIWFRRDDGSIAGLTYQRDEGVVGWHRHDFGGAVESVACIPSPTDFQDTLWMVVRRTINNQTRRYIERLYRFWDYDSTLATSHFADCGLRTTLSAPQDTFYGLTHLEGERVYGLADNRPFGVKETITVTDGAITIPFEAQSYIFIGLPYETYAETNRPNDGAADGTAQGKVARTNQLVPFVWQSAGGEVGMYNEDQRQDEFMELQYPYMAAEDLLDEVALTTGMLDIHIMPAVQSVRKSLLFRQTWPLPFNVIALMPQLNVQDR